MAQLKCVRPYISLWWLDLKPLAGSCCPWAGRGSLPAQPRPLHPFTNTEGSTLVASLSQVPWKVLTLDNFDCLELRVSSEVPCRAISGLHVCISISPLKVIHWTQILEVSGSKIVHFWSSNPKIFACLDKDTLLAWSIMHRLLLKQITEENTTSGAISP